ncbi:hypothetical protein EVAR_72724_1 [Eumeta japonica]|uniref:Uncharacterized protein n=1 Tax=Eumeta variegata TaxID=151549 RepID=A0A4C1SJL3_EUMVA|nr:hypothetical protein EVAR_72724_1 [Eumeta japonica]
MEDNEDEDKLSLCSTVRDVAKDDEEFDKDEVELAPDVVVVAVAADDEDELRMTRIDWDFSKRFNVCNTNGPLSSPVAVVTAPKRLLSVLKLRET